VPPADLIICAVSAAEASPTSMAATFSPSRANNIDAARPIPDPAPVISATFPCSLIGLSPKSSDAQTIRPARRLAHFGRVQLARFTIPRCPATARHGINRVATAPREEKIDDAI